MVYVRFFLFVDGIGVSCVEDTPVHARVGQKKLCITLRVRVGFRHNSNPRECVFKPNRWAHKAGFMHGKARTDDKTKRFSKTDCLERVQGDRDHRWYRSVTMSMNHAQNWTRPDLAYLVSKAAKFMQAPGDVHLRSLKKGL